MKIRVALALAALSLFGCETSPPPGPTPAQDLPSASVADASPYWDIPPDPVAFERLPNWETVDLRPGLRAFSRSCTIFERRDEASLLSPKAPWAGQVSDWMPACAALDVIEDDASARAVLQALFTPVEISDREGSARFTGYFEPEYTAMRSPVPPYTEPVPGLPSDLVPSPDGAMQRRPDGRLQPYPTRAQITRDGVIPLAYAHPADVFFLQIQGSGRLTFPDGQTFRAAYAANNGHPFKSTANWLLSKGWISRGEASMTGIRAWMDRTTPARAREAMNANPRFIFFKAENVFDPALGPKGALGVPLEPLGSMAVDLSIHAGGLPMFVETSAPGLGGDWSGLVVAQDTGGAITGPVRGDLYFGTGAEAGAAADTVNREGRMWVLLPRRLAEELRRSDEMAALGLLPVAP